MKKNEVIARYGEIRWEKYKEHYRITRYRKGGKYYEIMKKYEMTGLRAERRKVRDIDSHTWLKYKKILDPEAITQVHHLWKEGSADVFGVAIVDMTFTHIHEDCDVMLDLEFNSCAKIGRCELCGEEGFTHWHHPDGRVSVIAMFACLEVCPKCHKAIEHMTVDEVIAYHDGIKREQRK